VRVIFSPSLTARIFVDATRQGSGGTEKQGEIRGAERRNDAMWDAAGIVRLVRSVFTSALPREVYQRLGIRPLSLLGLRILAGDREVINLQ
jgi:hypothetical protein